MAFNYPGNIRELKAVVDLAAVMCKDALIEEEDIIFSFSKDNEAFMLKELTMREYIQLRSSNTFYRNTIMM